jgi:hypothetical protein
MKEHGFDSFFCVCEKLLYHLPNIAEGAKFINWFLNDKNATAILGDVRSVPVSALARQAANDAGKITKITSDALGALFITSPQNRIFGLD